MRALTTAVGLGALVVASSALAASPPRLVLLVAVDQLRRDRLDEGLPGGLGRIAREGRVFVDAMLDHAATETCPGHATMLTGRHPGPIGITSNTWIDLETGERRYCVDDPSPDAAVIGGVDLVVTVGGTGVSPRDVTPDATTGVLDRPVPGIAEAIRASGLAAGAVDAGVSRGVVGVSGSTLVVNLAASRAAVRDGMATPTPLVPHVISELSGLDD